MMSLLHIARTCLAMICFIHNAAYHGINASSSVDKEADIHNTSTCGSRPWPCDSNIVQKIAGGGKAPEERFQYMVSLRNDEGGHTCGGVLIHPLLILTAAHCIDTLPVDSGIAAVGHNYIVCIGSQCKPNSNPPRNAQTRVVGTFFHPEYINNRNAEWDVAVSILPEPVNGIKIPKLPENNYILERGRKVVGLGWGATGKEPSDDLKMIILEVLACAQACPTYESSESVNCSELCQSHNQLLFLTSNEGDTCAGDSGGPVLVPHVPASNISNGYPELDLIVGITSRGQRDCKIASSTGIYINISSVADWIRKIIKDVDRKNGVRGRQAPPLYPWGMFIWAALMTIWVIMQVHGAPIMQWLTQRFSQCPFENCASLTWRESMLVQDLCKKMSTIEELTCQVDNNEICQSRQENLISSLRNKVCELRAALQTNENCQSEQYISILSLKDKVCELESSNRQLKANLEQAQRAKECSAEELAQARQTINALHANRFAEKDKIQAKQRQLLQMEQQCAYHARQYNLAVEEKKKLEAELDEQRERFQQMIDQPATANLPH